MPDAAAPPTDGHWAGVPESMDTGRKLKALEKAFADHLYATHKLSLWENRTLGLLSRPGESEADFRKRCRAAADEQKKQAVEMEKVKFRPKFDSLGVSLPDEKPKRRQGRTDDDPKLEEKRRKLKTDYQSKVAEITEKWKRVGEEAAAIQVKPRKADVHVTHFGLAWAPYCAWPAPADRRRRRRRIGECSGLPYAPLKSSERSRTPGRIRRDGLTNERGDLWRNRRTSGACARIASGGRSSRTPAWRTPRWACALRKSCSRSCCVSGNSGCNRFLPGEPARAEGSGAAPPTAEPAR